MEDLTLKSKPGEAIHETGRRFAHRLLDLAAEMRVDGVPEVDCDSIAAAAENLLVESVKAERRLDAGLDKVFAVLNGELAPNGRPWPYRPEGEICNGVEVSSGRWACCGAQAVFKTFDRVRTENYGEHAEFCPRTPEVRNADDSATPLGLYPR